MLVVSLALRQPEHARASAIAWRWLQAESVPHISYHGIKSNFSTQNTKQAPLLMEIRLTEGPFTHMDGTWRFTPLGDTACKIEFRLHYEFSSKLLEKALGPVFHHIANTFVESFVKWAGQVYG